MRMGIIAAGAILIAGAAPVSAQSNQQIVIDAVVDNGCELSRPEARRALRGSGLTPQDARQVARDLVAAGRGRVENGTFIYTDGPCAPARARQRPAEETEAPDEELAEALEAAEARDEMAAETENRLDDMVALIRANDCEMTADEADVVFDAARLSYFEIGSYLMELVDDEDARFDGQTVTLSPELCEDAN
jgi:hypothetical protein